jgi:hypothetical protein
MLVEKFTHVCCCKPVFELKTFYGQLEHIYIIQLTPSSSNTQVNSDLQTPIFLTTIQNCKIREQGPTDLEGLDIHLYSTMGGLDVVHITSIQALISRVRYTVDGGGWAVID